MLKDSLETTLFFIKPPAINRTTSIIKDLKKHFNILSLTAIQLPKSFWLDFHHNDPMPYRELNAIYLDKQLIVMGIIEGINAKQELLNLCGHTYISSQCHPNSLRHKHRDLEKHIKINGFDFYINAIHRAMPEDADKEVSLYLKKVSRKIIKKNAIEINLKDGHTR